MKKYPSSTAKLLSLTAFVCALTLLAIPSVSAQETQNITDGSTPLGLTPGAPAGSYALSDLDTVNLYNGSLSFRLPLVKIGGRGSAGYTMVVRIEHKWTVEKQLGNPHSFYFPNPDWWNPESSKTIYSTGRLDLRKAVSRDFFTACGSYIYRETLSRLTFTAPDGTEYELRDQLTNGKPDNPTCTTGFNRGKVFTTSDGSTATFISDSDIVDEPEGAQSEYFPSGYMVFRDGTRYRIDNALVTWMRDRNGNKVTFSYDAFQRLATVTDSLNRQITISYANQSVAYDQITLKGFGGATRTLKVYQSTLANTLRSDCPFQDYPQLFPELNGASGAGWIPVISAVELPNGQQYQFKYNSYAELARVVLPTGGATEYDYAAGLTDTAASGVITAAGDKQVYRRVVERRIYPDGGSGASYATRMTYSRPETNSTNAGYVTADQYNSSGALLSRSNHFFYGSPRASFGQLPTKYPAWKDGREYQTIVFAADGTTPLRQVNNTFVQRASVSWWTGDPNLAPPNDPRITDTTTTLSDTNQVSKQTFGYDDSVPFNNQNNVKEYDFGNDAPGALVRETTTTFITATNYTGNNVSLLSLPSQTSVYAGGVERARTTFEYDNYNTDTNHAALVNRSGISGFDASFGSSYLTRGNTTATTHYLLTNGSVTGSVTSYAQYDIAGNAVKAIDARGYATTIDYSDCFGSPDGNARLNSAPVELSSVGQTSYAFPTLATNALGQTAYTQFDYYLGRPVDGEDANGIVSSGYYNDVLDRPTQVVSAVNTGLASQTAFGYDDVNRIVTTTGDQITYGDNLLKSQAVYDGLGRTTEKRQYETSSAYITVRQTYDALGRAYQTSNPFRAGENTLWTTTAYDVLNRVISLTTPDSAVVTTSYSGNTVTVTDQIGKARKSVTDGLGRLIQVYEAPNDANYNYLTSYSYDTLDDLKTVNQGSQTRTFVYDSLKRLTSATNPESGTSSYQYDNNGNLTSKTDARSVATTYVYDALNRATSRSYSDGTPTVSYFYDAQTLPPGAPTYARGYSTGRLVATTYGTNSSAGDYYSFDARGRSVLKIQQTGAVNYQTSATYNLAGAMTTETYPSGHTTTYAYDQSGRTTSLSGNLGDGTTRTYSTGIVYSSLGGMTKEQFGTTTPIYNKLFYNSRGQLSEIRESTSYTGPTDTTWDRGAIINHYSNTCWGMCSGHTMTDDNGNLKKQEVYIPNSDSFAQFYGYDALNRLQKVNESKNGAPVNWQQQYVYDRYGNRTIDQTNTYGAGIPKPNFGVDTNTNRLTAPAGSTMTYDAAGNLTFDNSDGMGGTRTYDAENRMKQAWANNQWQTYNYDGDGRRVKRTVNGTETWQVYGLGGELLAEYAANTAASGPQKEYGYRSGQLLITAIAGSSGSAPQNVTWTNAVGVSVSGNSLTKTAADGWGNAGAASTQTISSGDGYMEFTATETGTYRMIGLSNGDSDQSFQDIDFAFYLTAGGAVYIYESGISRGLVGNFATGDVLRLAVEGGVVKYKKNGTVLYTSTVTPTYPLLVDTSLYSNGSTLNNVVIGSGSGGGGTSPQVHWLVTDQLGTPRMIFDQSGSLANVSRHDYLPFGEELFAGTGGRTTAQGYTLSDNVRQKFTQKERDNETGLDYFLARYYSSTQGRFTSPDEFTGGPDELYSFVDDASDNPTFYADLRRPQSLNKYQYAYNNPLKYVDPDGHDPEEPEPPQKPKPVVPVPVPVGPGLPVPIPVPIGPAPPGPTDQQIIEGVKSVLDTVCDYTGITKLADWLRPKIMPGPAPTTTAPTAQPQSQTTTPPTTIVQPMPPPPPAEAHRKGKRESTREKHERLRPGRPTTKNRENPDWRPRQRPKDWPKGKPWPPWKNPEAKN